MQNAPREMMPLPALSGQLTRGQTPRERRTGHERRLVVTWKVDDVQRQLSGIAEWFVDIDGGHLLDLLHCMPYDMHNLLQASAGQEDFLTRDDDEFATRGRDLSEKRLKALRQRLFEALQRRFAHNLPPLPRKTLHRIMLQHRLLSAAWSAVSSVVSIDISDPKAENQTIPPNSQDQGEKSAAARILLDYGTRYLKPKSLQATPDTLRALTRAADGLRFALSSPGTVAAAYAHTPASDSFDSSRRLLTERNGDNLNGKAIFQLAARNLATTLLEATKISLLALERTSSNTSFRDGKSFAIVSTRDSSDELDRARKPSVVRLALPVQTTAETENQDHVATAPPISPGSDKQDDDDTCALRVHEAIRLMRSALCALCALCPEKKDIVASGSHGSRAHQSSTVAAGAARQQLELLCNEILIPVGFMLEHVVGKAVPDPAFRTRVERAIRGPFASLLYLLSWHDDNLVSLFATQRNVFVRAALYWLSTRDNILTGESEQLIRRNLITVIWSFAKKKDRALELGTPDMIHPLLNCLAYTESQRDIRFTAAGALEKILTHRSSLTMMPKDDLGSDITMSKRSLPCVFSENEPPPPPMLTALLKRLLPTLGIIFLGGAFDEDEEDNETAPSSGYLQLALAACANLAYLAIACEKEQPEYAIWLRDELRRSLLLKSKESEHHSIMPTGDVMIAIQSIPELQEPRVFYEALRLLWVLLRLRIHPNNRNDEAARSLFRATGELDVECASAGVIFDNVPPDDLKLHFIQDLLRYVQSEEHEMEPSSRDTEPLRTFTTWILAHYTYRPDDGKHITYQNAFNTIARLITDDGPRALFTIVQKAVEEDGNILVQQEYTNATAKLLTLKLLARCLRNLAQSEITATLVVEHTKLGAAGALHALNRLAWLGWCLEATRANSMFQPVPAVTMYLTSGGHYYRQLASHTVVVDEEDSNRKQHICVPVVVRLDHTDKNLKRRIRHAATDESIHFSDNSTAYQVRPGCVPNSIQILQEVAETLELLAAHNQIRGFFATHGTLGLVVRLALHGRFSAGVAFRILLDTPRTALVNHVIMSHTANQESGTAADTSSLFFTTPSHRTRKMYSPRPRWLVADIHELILRTIESAPPVSVSDNSETNQTQTAALLALQLATSILVHDDTKLRPNANSRVQESLRGKQVVVYYGQTGELMTGVCLKIYGASTQATVDVIMDSGNVHYGVTLKNITMVELSQHSRTPRSASSVSHHSLAKEEDLTAYFVKPSQFGSRNVETSLFSYFVHEADRFFSALDRCSSNVSLAPDACSLCETLSNVLRRYLHSGDVELMNDILGHLGAFCERQLARLVSDCACDVCPDCPSALQDCIGASVYAGGHGQIFTTLYLFEASILLYRHKKYASCSHRGFVFGIPTLMFNAVSALHAQIYNSGLGELPAKVQLKMIQLSQEIRQPHAESTQNNEDTDENEGDGQLEDKRPKSLNASLSGEGASEDAVEDLVRNGNNLVNGTFRAVLAVLELARAADAHRVMRKSESQPLLLREMMASQRKIRSLERGSSQNLTQNENSSHVDDKTARRPSDARVLGRSSQGSQSYDVHDKHMYTRKILFGVEGIANIDDVNDSSSGRRKRAKNRWSMNADENPLYLKIRSLCCQVVRLGVGPRTVRLHQESHSQHSAIRSSIRLLTSLGSDMLMARRMQETPPTASKKFVTATIRCIKWHPHWVQCQNTRKEQIRRQSGQDINTIVSTPELTTVAPTLPSTQVAELLAIEACKLVQQLSTHLSQRHLMVFPDTARKHSTIRRRRDQHHQHQSTSDEGSDDEFVSAYDDKNDEAVRQRSINGCLPVLTLLAGAFRGDVSTAVRAAAVGALKEIASNSTICSEAICAHDGVKQLVTAAHVGDHTLRRNVALIFSLIAMAPSIREQLLKEHHALLLLLQLQAPRDNPYFDDDAQIVAYAAKALKYLSTNTALVYLEALKIAVARIDVWNASTLKQNKNNHVTTTIGVSLLGPGYPELLQLALDGLGDAASHAEMADVLIANRGIECLLDCLQIRNANIITSTVRTLASLMNQAVAFERRRHSANLICQVVDRLLMLIWPYAHRAARSLQSLCRQRMSIRKTGIAPDPLSLTLVPVTSSLVGLAATAIERVARDHGLGDYLVHKRAIDALIARLTPDGYKEDEEECMRLYSTTQLEARKSAEKKYESSIPLAAKEVATNEKETGSLRADPPIVKVLSAIAQLASNTPHSLPSGRPERTLSLVYAFHHNNRCRHLAMLALWRIRPVAIFGPSADASGLAEVPQELYQEGQNASLAPPPPVYWNDDDVITWLGCIGFGSLGKSMRRYLSSAETKFDTERLQSVKLARNQNYCHHSGWTRGSVERDEDPYGQATAGEKLLALTSTDLQVGGRLGLTETQATSLEIGAFASELRELHLRMREANQPYVYDVRVPVDLLLPALDNENEWPSQSPVIPKRMETEVILHAWLVRRYRALYAEASDILTASEERSASISLSDLAHDTIMEARRAYQSYKDGDIQGAKIAAELARTHAAKVLDAVSLNRVKLSAARDTEGLSATLDDVGELLLGNAVESETLRWGDTLWYELSSAPSVDTFNQSRLADSSTTSQGITVGASNSTLTTQASPHKDSVGPPSPSERSSPWIDVEDVCLWPTEGYGIEAARVRHERRMKKTPNGILQKAAKEPIRDKRGIAHLFEVRFIDVRVLLPGGRTALMMCAKEGDLPMVQLLLDKIECHLNERLTPKMLDVLRQQTRRRRQRSVQLHEDRDITATSKSVQSTIFEVLDPGARPNAIDEHGNTALHHALRSLLRGIEKAKDGITMNPEHLFSRIEVVHTLLQRVALPHSATVFSHGENREESDRTHSRMFAESYHGIPSDALALLIRCYSKTQRRPHISEQTINDETKKAGYPLNDALEVLAEKIDGLLAYMIQCGFSLSAAAVREAEHAHLLARLRYLYVEHCNLTSLEGTLRTVPDVFLKRNVRIHKAHNNLDIGPILPRSYTNPWETPVFAIKRLQTTTQKIWMSRMVYHVNRQLLMYVIFIVMILYVAAEIVGMDVFLVSRDALQQALRTRLVEEEWYPSNGFLEVATPEDWWQWAEGPLLGAIYEPALPRWKKDGTLDDHSHGDGTFPLLGGLGLALGQPRLRMVATQPNEDFYGACSYNPANQKFGRENDACFSFFGEAVQMDRTLQLTSEVDDANITSDAFDFKNAARGWLGFDAPSIYGYQAYYPGSGGYVAALPKDETAGRALIASLKNSSWVSQNTRAIILEFMCYSPSDHHSHNLITNVRLVAEFSATGSVLCSGHIRALRLFLYRTSRDFFRLFLELGWLVGCFLLFRSEVQQMAASFDRAVINNQRGNPSFGSFVLKLQKFRRGISNYAVAHFNIFDLAQFHTFVLLVASHILSIVFASSANWDRLVKADDTDRMTRKQLSTVSIAIYLGETRLTLLGLYVLLSFLKLLDRMRVRESLHVLIVEEMFKKIFTFLIVMTICVLAFTFTSFFSRISGARQNLRQGSLFLDSFVSQMRAFQGEIDFGAFENPDPYLSILFSILTFLVLPVLLMNLLIAIMLEAYESVRGAAAARYCYLQLVAHSEYIKEHVRGDSRTPTNATHWIALVLGAVFFPILVIERIIALTRRGLHYVWTDVFYPQSRQNILESMSSQDSEDSPPPTVLDMVKTLRKIKLVRRFAKAVRVHPSPSNTTARSQVRRPKASPVGPLPSTLLDDGE